MRSPALRGLGLLLLLPTAKGDAGPADGGAPKVAAAPPPRLVTPILGHPRLWLRPEDPPRLRAWAKASNPLWSEGLRAVGERAREEMDRHGLLDRAGCERAPAPCEAYAELFAFLSLVEPSAQERQDYGRRGHAVLMGLLRRAARPVPGDPLGAPDFSVGNASRWSGEAFPLAVDWLYPRLAAADKAMARQVFLRWSEEQLRASVMGADHPAPVGLLHDPALLADRPRRRAAANNYFCAHLRNLTLMALALDPADDPDEPAVGRTYRRLGDYLANAVGAWLYMNDHLLRHEARGGLSPEGDQYGPQSLAYVAQTHLALRTAGVADPKVWGPAVELDGHPFWDRLVPAFLHHLSPSPRRRPEGEGLAFQPHWMGDGQVYDLGDWIDLFAPFGILGRLRGRDGIFDAARWIQRHAMVGGEGRLVYRASSQGLGLRRAIFYFLLFDPTAPSPADPRPALPLAHFAEGTGVLLARTAFRPEASWLYFQAGWNTIDHRHGDGGDFGLWRRGEWLTKERTGYSEHYECSDQHNTLALENDRPTRHTDSRRGLFWRRGSQYVITPRGDARILATATGEGLTYALADLTELYNSSYESVGDLLHASRALVWLQPDHVVIYDRAAGGRPGRFKRFWLQTPSPPQVDGRRAWATTDGGQTLHVSSLLPERALLVGRAYDGGDDWATKLVAHETMGGQLLVEAEGAPKEVRFLHVLQGADRGAKADPVHLVRSDRGPPWEGVAVAGAVVLFPSTIGAAVKELSWRAPGAVGRHLVTGLPPGSRFRAERRPDGDGERVTLTADPLGLLTDGSGLLRIGPSGPGSRP